MDTLIAEKIEDNENKIIKNDKNIKKQKMKQNSAENRIPNCTSNLKKFNINNKINIFSKKSNNCQIQQMINTTETTKKNNSVKNRTYESYNQSRDSKSNMSNFDKRKEYKVPPVKAKIHIQQNEAEEVEEEEVNEDEKKEKISNLMLNQEAIYFRYLQKLLKDDYESKNNKNIEIKKKYIKDSGIDLDLFNQETNYDNDNDEDKNNNEYVEEKKEEKIQNKKSNKNNEIKNKNEEEIFNNEKKQPKSKKTKNKQNINNKTINKNNYLNENINMNLSHSSENPNVNIEQHANIPSNINNIKYIDKNEKYPLIENNNYLNNLEDDQLNNISKTKRKPSVNTLEFYDRIIQELNVNTVDTIEKNEKNKIMNLENHKNQKKPKHSYYDDIDNNNDSLGESFRRKSLTKNDQNVLNYYENINDNYNDIDNDNDVGFNYKTKKNTRSKIEIKQFIEKKRRLNKTEEEKNLKNTQAKKLNKFLGLYKLQEDINVNQRTITAKLNKAHNTLQNYSNITNNNFNDKTQIPNEYYIGKRKNLHRKNSDLSKNSDTSQSTVLEENNYYMNIINSKNILSNNPTNDNLFEMNLQNQNVTNNKNKSINNINCVNNINNENCENYENNETNENYNENFSSDLINSNIIEDNNLLKEKSEKENSGFEKRMDMNEDIFLKCKNTLDKANLLFSKTKIEEMINNYKTNSDKKNNKSNLNSNESNDENNNININELIMNNNNDPNTIIDNHNNNINASTPQSNKSLSESRYQEFEKDSQEKNNIIIDTNNNIQTSENEDNDNINKNEENNLMENNLYTENNDENLMQSDISTNNKNDEIKDIAQNKQYCFSDEELEKYYEIFTSIGDYLKLLTQRNILNDIITYGDQRYRFKIGFEQIIIVFKSSTFNLLRLIYQRQYYKAVLRQFFIPYLSRAFNNIQYYICAKQQFSGFINILEQIYRIVFLKRLDFYGQIKQILIQNEKNILNQISNGINLLNNFFKKKFFYILYDKYLHIIANNKSNVSSQRFNTYLYESFTEKSSVSAYPNSEGSAKLHKVYELLEMQKKKQIEEQNNNCEEHSNFEENNIIEFGPNDINNLSLTDKSNRSIKSSKNLEEICKMKPGINIDLKGSLEKIMKNKENSNNKKGKFQLSPTSKDDLIKQLSEVKNVNNNIDIKDEDGLNIPYEENLIKIKEMQKIKENEKNQNININNNIESNNVFINSMTELIKEDENLPNKKENEQYEKIEISKEINKNNINNYNLDNNKHKVGCIKKIEITGNFVCRANNLNTSEDISLNKENNQIDWDFSIDQNIIFNNNPNNLESLSNKEKLPTIENLVNKKEDLLNSLDFKSNIKNEVVEESDIIISDSINEENKELIDLTGKKSRNDNKENSSKQEFSLKDINNNNSEIIKSLDNISNNSIAFNLSSSFKKDKNTTNNDDINKNNIPSPSKNLRYNQENNQILNEVKDGNLTVKIFKNLSENEKDKIGEEMAEQILNDILLKEITDTKKHLFNKKREISSSLNNSSVSLLVSQNSMSIGSRSPGRNYNKIKNKNLANNNDSYQTISSTTSQVETILNNSIFMRTVEEIQKEKNLNLYNNKIAPVLIEKIEENINNNYKKIIDNLQLSLKIDEAKMINGLMLKDRSLSISSKIIFCNENIKLKEFIDQKILTDFEKINKEIRGNNNNIIYDKILNKCVFDTTNEIIEKYRKYGIIGEPLPWSIRTRDMSYKFKNDNYSLNIFKHLIIKELKKNINVRMGLIAENYEHLDMEQLNQDRDKKFMESILGELKDNEDYYQIFETQETYVKLSLSRIIMDQLLNEIVEILEHVQYSRKEPDKYQSKSIYACEDIPRLSFQPATMENNFSGNYEGDESINQ